MKMLRGLLGRNAVGEIVDVCEDSAAGIGVCAGIVWKDVSPIPSGSRNGGFFAVDASELEALEVGIDDIVALLRDIRPASFEHLRQR